MSVYQLCANDTKIKELNQRLIDLHCMDDEYWTTYKELVKREEELMRKCWVCNSGDTDEGRCARCQLRFYHPPTADNWYFDFSKMLKSHHGADDPLIIDLVDTNGQLATAHDPELFFNEDIQEAYREYKKIYP